MRKARKMKQYVIDQPDDCETWFLWEGDREEMLASGSLEAVIKGLKYLVGEKRGSREDKASGAL